MLSAPLRRAQPAAPLAAADLLLAYKELAVRVRAAVPGLFAEVPSGDFDIRATAWISEPATPVLPAAGSRQIRPPSSSHRPTTLAHNTNPHTPCPPL